jgi:hypothetical protein
MKNVERLGSSSYPPPAVEIFRNFVMALDLAKQSGVKLRPVQKDGSNYGVTIVENPLGVLEPVAPRNDRS